MFYIISSQTHWIQLDGKKGAILRYTNPINNCNKMNSDALYTQSDTSSYFDVFGSFECNLCFSKYCDDFYITTCTLDQRLDDSASTIVQPYLGSKVIIFA